MKITKANEDVIADVIAEAVRHHVAARLGPIVDLVNAQQERLESLESRPPSMRYREVWNASERYVPGDVCTYDGGMWFAKAESQGRKPGGDSSGSFWRLCVRRGAQGKPCQSCTPSEP